MLGAAGPEDPRVPNGATGNGALGGANVAGVGTPPGGFGGPAATGAGAKAIIPIDLRSVRVEPVQPETLRVRVLHTQHFTDYQSVRGHNMLLFSIVRMMDRGRQRSPGDRTHATS
jgi:hypothetical protein